MFCATLYQRQRRRQHNNQIKWQDATQIHNVARALPHNQNKTDCATTTTAPCHSHDAPRPQDLLQAP